MPHFTIQYSANLEAEFDLAALCAAVEDTVVATGLFELSAARVRAFRADHVALADRLPQNAFVDMVFRIGKGRSPEEKQRTGDAIIETARQFFARRLDGPHFALSLEIQEIDAPASWKLNTFHARLRAK